MKSKPTKKNLKEFGITVGIGIPLIFGVLIPKIFGHAIREWTIFIGIVIIIFGIFLPQKLEKIYKVWINIGLVLGWINSKIILGMVFILILQPIAILMKFTGYDPLRMKINQKKSFREKCTDEDVDFKKTF